MIAPLNVPGLGLSKVKKRLHFISVMRAKAELTAQIVEFLKQKKWTQAEAAEHCGITQPRMNDMMRGRISRFSLDALVNITAALGQKVHIQFGAA